MQFDKGYLSPHFVTDYDSDGVPCSKTPTSSSTRRRSAAIKDLVPRARARWPRPGKPLLIIAEDIEGEALATLVVNKLRGTLKVCAVKAPGFGDRRKAMLEDIAILTGGQADLRRAGHQARERRDVTELGRAKKISVDKDNTTIIEGAGTTEAIKGRIEQIKNEIDNTTSDYDSEKLQERLAKLAGGVAQINVGAATEVEMKEKKARVEDAHARLPRRGRRRHPPRRRRRRHPRCCKALDNLAKELRGR